VALVQLDIQRDCYPLALVPKEKEAEVRALAKKVGQTANRFTG